MSGFPQPVSQMVVLSSVLPMLIPGVMSGTAAQASSSVIGSSAGGLAAPPVGETASAGFNGGGRRQESAGRAQKNMVSGANRAEHFMVASGTRWFRVLVRSRTSRTQRTAGSGD